MRDPAPAGIAKMIPASSETGSIDQFELIGARGVTSAFGVALVFVLGCAYGQDLRDLRTCTRLSDNLERLSCYDAAMGIVKSATLAPKPQASPSRGSAQNSGQAQFGDNGQLHIEPKPALPRNLTARVLEVMPLPSGLYRLTLDNGQVWNTTQGDSALEFKVNDAVTISRLLLGGYQISLVGHTTSVSAARKE